MTFSHHKAFFEIPIKILFFLVFLQKKCSIQTVDLFVVICLGYVRAFNIQVKVLFMII